MNPARIESHDGENGSVVISVFGEIDLAVHEQLTETLTGSVSADGVKSVLVDLSQTSFLDSGGIRALIEGQKAAHAYSIEYTVTGATGMVRQVLEVTGVLLSLTGEAAGP